MRFHARRKIVRGVRIFKSWLRFPDEMLRDEVKLSSARKFSANSRLTHRSASVYRAFS
jgi:hypothetical protein